MKNNRASNITRTILSAILGFVLVILSGLAVFFLLRSSSSSSIDNISSYTPMTPRSVEFESPELSLTDVDGNAVRLSDLRGKVVLLNNWAFWCAPCRAELPELEAYYQAHKDQAFTIIGIEAGSEKEDVVNHIEMYQLTYPIWLDPKRDAVLAFRNGGLPNSYLIDKNGIVRLAWSGATTRQTLEKYVTPLINGE